MDEAAARGDLETLEKAMCAWGAQGLDPEVLVDAKGMLQELKEKAVEVRGELERLLRSQGIPFEADGTSLTSAGRVAVEQVISLLRRYPMVAVEIHGYYGAHSK